ncbi:MAG: hypothetical protein M3Q63_03365 [bacterium]|nr:hypothetical protein [bacterium]
MTLVEYSITFCLLAFIMIIGLNACMDFYSSSYTYNEYMLVRHTIESSRNKAFNREDPVSVTRAQLQAQSPSLDIAGPNLIVFNSNGEPNIASLYRLQKGLFFRDIYVHENGSITE